MAHWTDKRTAKAMVGSELARRGWKLYGWTPDRSDAMTDYYAPEHWDGLAEKGGALCVVACGPSTGYQPVKSACDVVADCARCHGTGEDPNGWTYQKAKADPRAWHADVNAGTGAVSMLPDVVSPIPFRDYGPELCRKCHGGGKVYGNHRTEPDGPAWPAHHGNPPHRLWHVERDGKILASGSGVYSVAEEHYQSRHDADAPEDWDDTVCKRCGKAGTRRELRSEDCPKAQPKLRALVDRIEAAAFPKRQPPKPDSERLGPWYGGPFKPDAPAPEAPTVSPGLRPGIVELRFSAKPDETVRAALKAAGFRWAPSSSCWYGPEAHMPTLDSTETST